MIEKEKLYDIFVSKEEEAIYFVIKPREGEPVSPKILYDGKEHAVLYRTPEQTLMLDYLSKDAKECLKAYKVATIIEGDKASDAVVHQYDAPIRVVSMLPVLKK